MEYVSKYVNSLKGIKISDISDISDFNKYKLGEVFKILEDKLCTNHKILLKGKEKTTISRKYFDIVFGLYTEAENCEYTIHVEYGPNNFSTGKLYKDRVNFIQL